MSACLLLMIFASVWRNYRCFWKIFIGNLVEILSSRTLVQYDLCGRVMQRQQALHGHACTDAATEAFSKSLELASKHLG